MTISSTLQNAINGQINAELASAYLYLSMVAYFEEANLSGFAHWMRMQNKEETSHAMRLFDFVIDRGGRVELQGLDTPANNFTSPLDAMERTLEHERKVTSLIHRLYEASVEESDYAAQVLMHEFITEQVEEEKSAEEIVEHLRLVGEDGTGLLMLDARLGERTEEE